MRSAGTDEGYAERRERMVERQLRKRGLRAQAVLEAMLAVPRERFVPDDLAGSAYEDGALPIGDGQTISQPYVVALMIEALDLAPTSRVLEIGTGSGYGAAVLSRVAHDVVTIERHARLADRARDLLDDLGYDNIRVVVGDGSVGFSDAAPYDGIVVTAGSPDVPEALKEQLVDGGHLVLPVGPRRHGQTLLRLTRHGDDYDEQDLGWVAFVPLVGAQGWPGSDERMPEGGI